MAQITLPATKESRKTMVGSRTARLFFVDHWRAGLAILVVLHHVALVYGAGAPFYYAEPPFTEPAAYKVLLAFILLNQAWFMSAFFLLAGYFTPGSYDRKGMAAFLKDRLIRLGIPLALFYFVLNPIASIGYWQMPPELTGITAPLTWQAYPELLGVGPLWFVAMLLIFSIAYAGWRLITQKRDSSSRKRFSAPSYLAIGLFVVALALVSYGLRRFVPMGKEVLGFPTLAYLPQYVAFFVLGTIATRNDWFRTLPGSKGVVGFVVAVVATVLLFPLALSGNMFSLEVSQAAEFTGNGLWQSAVYAFWDSIFAVGMGLAALSFFRRFLSKENRLGTFLSQQSYAVYIIHVPIIVLFAVLLKDAGLTTLPKFAVAATIVVPTCFVVAYVLRRIPGVARVL
jgi:peptidoglycan/LPS O-acetylase OafA/YrhL